jgi:hypothetical protein
MIVCMGVDASELKLSSSRGDAISIATPWRTITDPEQSGYFRTVGCFEGAVMFAIG